MNLTTPLKSGIKWALDYAGLRADAQLRFQRFQTQIHPSTKANHNVMLQNAKDAAPNAAPEAVKEVCRRFQDKLAHRQDIRVLLHIPPSTESVGGFSLFNNLLKGLNHLGIQARAWPWESNTNQVLNDFNPTVVMTSDHDAFLSRIDWSAFNNYRRKHALQLGLTASLAEDGTPDLERRLKEAKGRGVNFFYTFHCAEDINQSFAHFIAYGYPVFSIEFGANPLIYHPVPGTIPDLDYVFLASNNPAKWARYHSYLGGIFKNKIGFIDGPGWSFCKQWSAPQIHRFLYARARVGLNLHIDKSLDRPTELNERTYILAACGVPQLVDNAALLSSRFPQNSFFIAHNPKEYEDQFEYILTHPEEAQTRAAKAFRHVLNHHTSFHRAESFIQQLEAVL